MSAATAMAAAPSEQIDDVDTIVGAELAAGHDGEAELIVRVRFTNGVVGDVMLDAEAGYTLMRNCGAAALSDLAGRPWRLLFQG